MTAQNLKFLIYLIFATVEEFIKVSENSSTVSAKQEAKQSASLKWPWVISIKYNISPHTHEYDLCWLDY